MADTVDIADLAVNFVSNGVSDVLGDLSSVAGKLGGFVGPAAVAGVALAGVGIAAAGAAIHMAADFQEGLTQLVTGAGESKKNLDLVSSGILGIARDTGTSTQQLLAGMFNIESAGFHGAAGLKVLQAAAEGAKVGNADLASVSDVLTTALHDYGLSGDSAVAVTNSLIKSVSDGKMHMQDLNGALTNVLPVASALHVPLADVEGALSTMAAAGDKGASAGTHLSMMLKMLANPAGTASKEMQAMGINSVTLAQTMSTSLPSALQMIQDAVGQHFTPGSVEYNRAISTILGGSKSGIAGLELMGKNMTLLGANTKDMSAALAASGKQVTGWDEVQGDFNQVIARGQQAIAVLGIQLGMALLPAATKVANFFVSNVMPAISGVISFLVAHQAVLPALAVVIGGALVGALAAAAVAAWGLMLPFLPLIGIVAGITIGIAALTAGVIYAYQHWAPFRDAVNELVGIIQTDIHWVQQMMSAIKLLGNVFADVAVLIHDVMTGQWGKLAGDVTKIQRDWNNDMQALANQQAADAQKAANDAAKAQEQAQLQKNITMYNNQAAADEQSKQQALAQAQFYTNEANNTKNATLKAQLEQQAATYQAQAQGYANDEAAAKQHASQQTATLNQLNAQTAAGAQKTALQVLQSNTWMNQQSTQQVAAMRGHALAEMSQMQTSATQDANNMASNVIGAFQGIAAGGYHWGADASSSYAAGLMSNNGMVGQAAASLARQVQRQLGHSTPSEGPMAGDDQWFYHLAQNLAAGLTRGAPLVGAAAAHVAGVAAAPLGLGGSLSLSGGALGPLPGGGVTSAAPAQPAVINVYLAGNRVAQQLIPDITKSVSLHTGNISH